MDLNLTIERMKDEVRDLIRADLIPEDVTSFSELHNHIDANELGGL